MSGKLYTSLGGGNYHVRCANPNCRHVRLISVRHHGKKARARTLARLNEIATQEYCQYCQQEGFKNYGGRRRNG